MLKHTCWLTVMFVAALTATRGSAATFYIAPDGKDAASGTHNAPWATLRHTAQHAKPGDVVKVKSGTYRQTNVITACRGTADQPILFEAEGGPVTLDGSLSIHDWRAEGGSRYSAAVERPPVYLVWAADRLLLGPDYRSSFKKVRPTKKSLKRGECLLAEGRLYVRLFDDSDPNKTSMRGSVGHCLLLQSVEHTVWRGIGTAWGLNGYKLEGGSHDNLFADAELHHHGQGILEIGAARGCPACQANTFQKLHVHHVGLTKFEHGIYSSGVRTRVLGCHFHHVSGAAIHAYPEPEQGEYDGNLITEPLVTCFPEHFTGERPSEPKGHYTAVICWGKGGHRLTNNLIVGPFSIGISVRSSGNQIVNNTLVLEDGTGVFVARSYARNTVANNIIQTRGFYLMEDMPEDLDYNAYFGGKGWLWGNNVYAGLDALRKVGKEAHGLVADPRFVSPDKQNFHLLPGSPCLDAGRTLGAPVVDLLGHPRSMRKGIDLGA